MISMSLTVVVPPHSSRPEAVEGTIGPKGGNSGL